MADTPGTLEFLMRENDLLFVDNHKTLHSRTPLSNPLSSDRLMIRSWIASGGAAAGHELITRPGHAPCPSDSTGCCPRGAR